MALKGSSIMTKDHVVFFPGKLIQVDHGVVLVCKSVGSNVLLFEPAPGNKIVPTNKKNYKAVTNNRNVTKVTIKEKD